MKNYFLLLVALVLLTLLSPIGLVLAIRYNTKKDKYARDIAESIDQLGNVIMQWAFNKWLISDGGYKFGNIDETVSSCLGKNQVKNTLTKTGKWLTGILSKLDPNHSIDAIEINP